MPNPSPTPLSPNGPYSALLRPTRPYSAPLGPNRPHAARTWPPTPPRTPKPLRRQLLLRRQFHYAQPYSTPPMPPTPKPLRRQFHYAQPYSTPPMPPTPKPKGRRRQRDPQCRSAQEEAQPLNDPKQAHLVAYPASENISQIDSLELSSRLLSSEVACDACPTPPQP